jgi:hypothetical protein
MLDVDVEHVEAGRLGYLRNLDAAHQAYCHRRDDFVARQLVLHIVTNNIFGLHETSSRVFLVTFDSARGYIASAPELRTPVVALSLAACAGASRRCCCPMNPGQQRPSDARHLVGQRNGHHLERSPRQKLRQPRIFLRVLPGSPQHGMGPDHKNTPQVAVALLRDRPKLLFAPSRILSRDEPNPGCKITARPEGI